MTRYVVEPTPYGNTDRLNVNAKWQVVDLKPECETYETVTGAVLVEEQPPRRRQVAFCLKQGHANMLAYALNYMDSQHIGDTVRELFSVKAPSL